MADEVMEGVPTDDEDIFGSAASFLAAAVVGKDTRFTEKVKLQFYGLYKQATVGKCSGGRPGFWDPAGRAKWDAWAQVGDVSKEDAMRQYVELLNQIAPEWSQGEAGGQPKTKGAMGPVFSCLAAAEEARDADDPAGPRTLHEVAGEGDNEALTQMLEGGAAVDERNEDGCTPLHFAADRGSVQAAQALIAAGSDVNAQDADGQTPLHYAAVTENREVYDLLVASGADVSILDSQGTTAAENAPAEWGLG